MNTIKMQAKDILSRLSNEEKARLCSGADFWHTKSATGADPIMMSDGPHGLRAQMDKETRGFLRVLRIRRK